MIKHINISNNININILKMIIITKKEINNNDNKTSELKKMLFSYFDAEDFYSKTL